MSRPASKVLGSARSSVLAVIAVSGILAATCASASAAQSYTWAGAAVGMSGWSVPGNWVSNAAPAAGEAIDTLTFPQLTSAACTAMPPTAICTASSNDLAGITANALVIAGRGYGISGNAITLGAGGLTLTQPSPAAQGNTGIGLPITLGADQTWNLSGPTGGAFDQTVLGLTGGLNGSDRKLSITLSNGVFAALGGVDAELGPVTITGTDTAASPDTNGGFGLFPGGATPAKLNATNGHTVSVSHASLQGTGAVGALTTTAASVLIGTGGTTRTLQTASATFDAASTTAFYVYSDGATAGTDYAQLQSTGAVHLAGALQVLGDASACPSLPLGRVFTLVSTTGQLDGTYSGLPDGSTLRVGGCSASANQLQLAYHTTGPTQTVTATAVAPVADDMTPPSIAFVTPTNGQSFAQDAVVTAQATCTDDGSGVASCTYPATLDTATPGTHTFTVHAVDHAGNPNTQSIQYLVAAPDTTDPIIGVTTPAEGEQFVLDSAVSAQVQCADADSVVDSCSYPSMVDTSSLGAHTFTVTATDHAGNHATKSVDYTVVTVIDHTPPTITITSPSGPYTVGQAVAPAYTCTDPGGTGVQDAHCTGPATVDTTTVGQHTYMVSAVDDAGNTATKSVTYDVEEADMTPPVITITSPTEGQHVPLNSALSADFTCLDAPGGSGAKTCTSNAVDTSTAGQHTLTVSTSDYAGNSDTKSVHYVVDADTTPPTITITTPAEGQHFALGAAVAGAFSCDGTGSAVTACDETAPLDTSTAGAHTYTVAATDAAGLSASATVNYVVDAPSAPPPPPPGGGTGGGGTGTGTGAGTGTGTGTGSDSSSGAGAGSGPLARFSLGTLPTSFTPSAAGAIRLLIRCTAAVKCTGTAKITVPRKAATVRSAVVATIVIASARYAVAAKKSVRIVIKLNPIGRKRLRLTRGSLKATLTLTPQDRRIKAVKRTIKLKRPAR